MRSIADRVAEFWRNSRSWSLAWQLVVAALVILIGALVAATISDALYGSNASSDRADSPVNTATVPTTRSATTSTPRTGQTSDSTTIASAPSTTRRRITTLTQSTTPTTTRTSRLIPLTIASPSHEDSYDRDADFGGWVGIDGCKDTRAEVLIRSSQAPVTFTTSSSCTVKTGRWTDPWSGVTTTVAHDFQIDHTVPLANAWRSGAWSWTHEQRVAYANDLSDTDHLVPILASENESKSDDGPDQWKPPSPAAWCTYAKVWDHIKAKWHLSATQPEWNAVVAMAAGC